MIDNSLKRLLEEIEPKVRNIEDNRVELKALKGVYNTMQELIDASVSSYKDVFDFYDQDFIFRSIKIGNSNYKELIDKYNTAKYLLKTNDSTLQQLPQYQESLTYMDSLYKYLSGLFENIKLDYSSKSGNLEIQELLNKYYRILIKDIIFVEDIDEFISFIELNNLNNEDKLNIYKYICKSNIKQYTKSIEMKLEDDITLDDVEKIIRKNKKLLEYTYKEDISLDDYLENNIEFNNDYFLNRKVCLVHKIKDYYDSKQYMEILDYYKEFIKIIDLQKEFEKQKIKPKKLLFVFENNQSLVREFLNITDEKYKNCVLKNLIDIENDDIITIPKKKFENVYIYEKEEFVVKTVYSYLENGKVLVLGVLDKDEELDDFLLKNKNLFKETFNNIDSINLINDERDLLLKNIKLEDLVLNIDLETLDVKMEEEDAR